jgi:hypothetical protein
MVGAVEQVFYLRFLEDDFAQPQPQPQQQQQQQQQQQPFKAKAF